MVWVKGKTIKKLFPKSASTTFTSGNLVQMPAGYVTTATNQSVRHMGIILQDIKSTDADFASNTEVMVEIPAEESCEFEAAVTGTLTQACVGVKYDLSDASTVNQGGTTYGVVTCVGFITSTKGRFSLNSANYIAGLTN